MKKEFSAFIFILFFTAQIQAQSFITQVLNKEQFRSAATLTQDYDGDGDLDIVATRWEPAGIYFLENDSTKQFPATPIITEDLTFYIADIDAADFDNDGDIDYVVCFTNVDDGELSWFQRQDNGTYIKWTIATNKDFIEADVADFNGDGLVDIAAIGLGNSDETGRVYINQGNLFFTETIVAEGVHDAIDAEDIDGDGDIDLAMTGIGSINTQNGDADGSRTLINDGNGNFTVGKWLNDDYFSFTSFWDRIKIVDLNADGVQDVLAFSSTALGGLKFFDGTNVGPYNDLEAITIDDDNTIDIGGHFVVFDVDNNGMLDIVRQSKNEDRIVVLYQMETMVFEREYIELRWNNSGNPTAKMSFGDLDNDGDLDLISPQQRAFDGDFSWFENINGHLFKHEIFSVWRGVRIPKLVDWDNDGDLDIFATVSSDQSADGQEDELIMYENIDGKNFINWRLHDDLDYAADVEFADIDGDGDLDAFATALDADDLVWLKNSGFQANWVTDTIFPEGNDPVGIATDDIDGDGDADVIMCSSNDDKVFGFKNNGGGTFLPFVVDANIDGPWEVEIADLNNDGEKDIAVVATENNNSVVVYFNDGSENFSEEIIYSGASGRDLEIGDWDGNNTPDILVGFINSGADLICFKNNNGIFTPDTLATLNEDILSLKMADLDGDGDLDVVTGHDDGFSNDYVVVAQINEGGQVVNTVPLAEAAGGEVTGIDIGDVNNDGQLDIVFADFNRDDLVLLTIGCLVAPTPDVMAVNATCDENNGSATVDVSVFQNPTILWSDGQTTETAVNLNAGEYMVTVSDATGCSGVATINVDLIPTAEINVTGENTSCGNEDGTATVTVTNNININQIAWSNGAMTETIDSLPGGNYSVTVTDENNCEINGEVDIIGLENPVVDLGEDIEIFMGDTAILDPNVLDAIDFEWSTGENYPTISVTESGIYSVTVTNSYGCIASGEIEVWVILSNTNQLIADDLINVFPNPTHDFISVEFKNPAVPILGYQLMDATGKIILDQPLNTHQTDLKINLEQVPSGIYLLYFKTEDFYFAKKISKQ